MSLVGNLKDLGLAEILQIVSLSRKSGVLGIWSNDQEAKILFRQGQVVKAVATTCPVDLSGILLAQGIVDQTTLEFAKSLQQDGGFGRRLGDILISECSVDATLVDELLRGVVENTVYSLFGWEEGRFDFELQDNLDVVDDLRTDPLQLLLANGLSPQFLAMEGSRLLDERRYAASTGYAAPDTTSGVHNADFEFDLLMEPGGSGNQDESASIPPAEKAADKRLIVIDDDEGTRNAIAYMLQAYSYHVTCFGKSEDALVTLDTLHRAGESPTVLIDLVMPRMDGTGTLGGLELLELIHDNFPRFHVLVLSDRHDADAEHSLADMGYPLMSKPSPGEIATASVSLKFGDQLLLQLSGTGNAPSRGVTERVNIGDDLRREMGEEPVAHDSKPASTGISLLRGMLEELNDPALGGGIILLVLRFAAEFMARAVIFTVRENEIVGLGQFGIDDRDQSGDMRVRGMRFPVGEKTVFSQVVESQLPVKLQMDDSPWCRYLQEHLGGYTKEAFLGPIVSEGRVVAILYGDNGSDSKLIGDTDSLEIFISQAGIAMEKALLLRKLKEKHLEGM